MPSASLAPAPNPVYDLVWAWPIFNLLASIPANSIPADGEWMQQQAIATQGVDDWSRIACGGMGGSGDNLQYQVAGGLCGRENFNTNATVALGRVIGSPMYQPPLAATQVGAGFFGNPWERVGIFDWYLNWDLAGGAGVFDGETTGVFLSSWGGAQFGLAEFLPSQGGGAGSRVICGIWGRDDGGTQQLRYRSYAPTGTQLENVDLEFPAGVVAESWFLVRFVVVAAGAGRAPQLQIFIGDTVQPAITRNFTPGAGVLRSSTDWTNGYGVVTGVIDDSGTITRQQLTRTVFRGGRFLPDGTELLT